MYAFAARDGISSLLISSSWVHALHFFMVCLSVSHKTAFGMRLLHAGFAHGRGCGGQAGGGGLVSIGKVWGWVASGPKGCIAHLSMDMFCCTMCPVFMHIMKLVEQTARISLGPLN